MANELYDVIDGNIVENGEKAITAQSLKNTLYALADGIGQGGGFYYFDGEYDEGGLTSSEKAKAHNVEVLNKMPLNAPLFVVLDGIWCPVMMWQQTENGLVLFLAVPGEQYFEALPIGVSADGEILI